MNLYKRSDGRSPFWFYDAVDAKTGRRVRKSTGQTDKRAALKVALEQSVKLASTVREITLSDALDAYIRDMKANGRKSWEGAQGQADKLIGRLREGDKTDRWKGRFALDGGMNISALTPDHVADLKAHRADEGNALNTVAAEMRILRAACKLAEERGYQPPGVRKWKVPSSPPKLRYLSPEEAERVLRRLHPDTPVPSGRSRKLVVPSGTVRELRQDVHDLFLALVLTGGRWNEVATLTWRQVDLQAETATLFGWKTEKERTVPLIPEALEMFERRAKTRRGPFVFPGRKGAVRSAPTRAICRAMDAEGLNDAGIVGAFGKATNHTLRHTYASWLRQRGLGLDEVQTLLGHSNIAVTRIYAKVVDAETFKRAREALGGIKR